MDTSRKPGRPPGYELFFAPLAVVHDPTVLERITFAYIVSKFGHARQERDDGSRYFDHPKAAAWIFIKELGGKDPRTIIDTLLHDLSEDTYLLSPFRIAHNFGEDIALDVRGLTKLPKGKESNVEYLGRVIERGPWAIVAKLCDRLHNLRTLSVFPHAKQLEQLKETKEYHLRLLIPSLKKHDDPWASYAQKLEKLILSEITSLEEAIKKEDAAE